LLVMVVGSLEYCHSSESWNPEKSMKQYYVYILASKRNGTLYTGVTNDLQKRVLQHKNDTIEGFTNKYNVHMLVYFEKHNSIAAAIAREKQIKSWKRRWKLELIEKHNPEWNDLFYVNVNPNVDILDSGSSPE
jgi:putative endonuclease